MRTEALFYFYLLVPSPSDVRTSVAPLRSAGKSKSSRRTVQRRETYETVMTANVQGGKYHVER